MKQLRGTGKTTRAVIRVMELMILGGVEKATVVTEPNAKETFIVSMTTAMKALGIKLGRERNVLNFNLTHDDTSVGVAFITVIDLLEYTEPKDKLKCDSPIVFEITPHQVIKAYYN